MKPANRSSSSSLVMPRPNADDRPSSAPQRAGAALAAVPLEEGVDAEGNRPSRPASASFSARTRASCVEDRRQVEQRPRHGRDRDPVAYGALVGGQREEWSSIAAVPSALRGTVIAGLPCHVRNRPFRPRGRWLRTASGPPQTTAASRHAWPVRTRMAHRRRRRGTADAASRPGAADGSRRRLHPARRAASGRRRRAGRGQLGDPASRSRSTFVDACAPRLSTSRATAQRGRVGVTAQRLRCDRSRRTEVVPRRV